MHTNNDIERPDIARIRDLLGSGSPENCREVLESVLKDIRFSEINSLMLRLYVCMDIYISAKCFAEEIGITADQFASRFGSPEDIEKRLSTTEDMTAFLYETLMQCIEWRGNNVKERSGGSMKTAKKFIDMSYMNCDISLSAVADAVGLSPSYLSMLFKKETGQNFSDYLTSVRIGKAKELLCCTSKMVYEVAYDVGFRDYRYFSQIFKKCTGMTPRQFQYSMNNCPEKEIC